MQVAVCGVVDADVVFEETVGAAGFFLAGGVVEFGVVGGVQEKLGGGDGGSAGRGLAGGGGWTGSLIGFEGGDRW